MVGSENLPTNDNDGVLGHFKQSNFLKAVVSFSAPPTPLMMSLVAARQVCERSTACLRDTERVDRNGANSGHLLI